MAKKILIVDDEKEIVKLLTEFLSENGYETAAAYDGEEALETFDAFKPDLILLDLKMPKKNGYEVSEQIRKKSECAIVIVSGYIGQLDGVENAVRSGVNDFFTKPVDLQRLLSRVNLLLRDGAEE